MTASPVSPTVRPLPGSDTALVWRFVEPLEAISSAAVGGGVGPAHWVVNVGVGSDYDRTDLSAHAEEISADLQLAGTGSVLFTAAAVERFTSASLDGVRVDATVGVSKPTWAADPEGGFTEWEPGTINLGTINLVVQLPVALDPSAAVGAVVTATEAKTQALIEAGVPGTGTASDAVVIAWPPAGRNGVRERFAGPRSTWGSRLAMAVHDAVGAGIGKTAR